MSRERDLAQRVAIQQAIGAQADDLMASDDLMAYRDDHERVVRLTGCLGAVASDLCENRGIDQDALLLRLAAEVQIALEVRERERAAA